MGEEKEAEVEKDEEEEVTKTAGWCIQAGGEKQRAL